MQYSLTYIASHAMQYSDVCNTHWRYNAILAGVLCRINYHQLLYEYVLHNIFAFYQKFTNNSFRMVITWRTRNIWPLFPLKDKNDYKSCVNYKGDYSCGSGYIGETKHNAEVRRNEHHNPTESSEPSKHLLNNINHYFTSAIISNAPKNAKTGKNLEASYIALWKPNLND